MTAIACLVSMDRRTGYMLVDSMAMLQGRFGAHMAKATVLAHGPAVLACRGTGAHAICLSLGIGSFEDFDAMVQGAPAALRKDWPAVRAGIVAQGGAPGTTAILVGWSQSQRRIRAFLTSDKMDFVLEEGRDLAAPMIGVPAHLDTGKPVEYLLGQLEEMRRLTLADDGTVQIGGCAILSEVTEAGVSQRVVHRWPDRVGERNMP